MIHCEGLREAWAFYLGRTFDPEAKRVSGEPSLYGAKDLTTHAVCVLLTFPGLQTGDFRPWIDPDDAARIARFRESVDTAILAW